MSVLPFHPEERHVENGDMTMLRRGESMKLHPQHAAEISPEMEMPSDIQPSSSRFKEEFIENRVIGRGGYGLIMLCTHRLDGMQYAVKEINLTNTDVENKKILREVHMLALMKNKYVCRYNSVGLEVLSLCSAGWRTEHPMKTTPSFWTMMMRRRRRTTPHSLGVATVGISVFSTSTARMPSRSRIRTFR